MIPLKLEKKTGFMSSMPFEIREDNGNIFYSSDFTDNIANGRSVKFNVPYGEYQYTGNLVKLDFPVSTKSIVLPSKQRNIAGGRYDIIFEPNPNKCTIYYDLKLIVFDTSFRTRPMYEKYGIYFHELGHHWYKDESKADLYAVKKMLDYGFNPSQVALVFSNGLTQDKSEERKLRIAKILEYLTNNKG